MTEAVQVSFQILTLCSFKKILGSNGKIKRSDACRLSQTTNWSFSILVFSNAIAAIFRWVKNWPSGVVNIKRRSYFKPLLVKMASCISKPPKDLIG